MKGVERIWVLRSFDRVRLDKGDDWLPLDVSFFHTTLLARTRFSVKDADVVRFPLDVVSAHTRPLADGVSAPQ